MFGAPPIGYVMDPQFKHVFFGELWKYVCKYKYVVSTQLVAWQKEPSRYYVYQWQALGAYTRSLDTYFL